MSSELVTREPGIRSDEFLYLRTFGGCSLTRNGMQVASLARQRKGLALLAVIAASGDLGVSREVLLAYLWPESSEQRARTSLNQLIHAIRNLLDTPDLLIGSSVLRLNPDRITSDVSQFRDALKNHDHDAIVSLHTGSFLDGFYIRDADELERWIASTRSDLARSYARSLEALADAPSAKNETRLAVDLWRRLTEAAPLSSRAAIGFMKALDSAGERASALEHGRHHELLVTRELGVAVDASVKDLVATLKASPSVSMERSRIPSVAVLPFANTGTGQDDEHFSEGLSDELIVALGKVSGLRVTGRTSVFALKGRGLTARAIGDLLKVDAVLEGSVRRASDRIKVTVQLVNTADDSVIWSQAFDREVRDVFAVQEDIARAIAHALSVQLAGSAKRLIHGPADVASYDIYLKGRYLLNTRLTDESLTLAARLFEEVIARDPAYAPAYSGVSHAHAYRAVFSYARPHEAFARAQTAARQALALDDSSADAHVALGHTLFVYDFDWKAAEHELEMAIELEPANSTARFVYAVCLQDQARFDEALAQIEVVRSTDPLAPFIGAISGRIYVNSRQPDRAIRELQATLELAPYLDVAHQQLGHAYLQKGMAGEAIASMQQAARLSGPRDSAHLAYVLAVAGRREEALRIHDGLLGTISNPDLQSFHLAMTCTGLGRHDEAFAWLDRGYAERASFMDGVGITPAFDPLHEDPRWASLLERMRLFTTT